jgi:hypothetical protein
MMISIDNTKRIGGLALDEATCIRMRAGLGNRSEPFARVKGLLKRNALERDKMN